MEEEVKAERVPELAKKTLIAAHGLIMKAKKFNKAARKEI